MASRLKYYIKEEALRAVNEKGRNLDFCSPELQCNEEVVMIAIKQIGLAFQYASAKLKSNKVFIMKALHEGVHPWYLIKYSNLTIQSDIEVMSLAIEKSNHGGVFGYAKGEVALNKELAAKALVKWGNGDGNIDFELWMNLHPTLQEFFPKDCFYEKAQSYLYQLEQEKRAELVTGGSTEEDEVVW